MAGEKPDEFSRQNHLLPSERHAAHGADLSADHPSDHHQPQFTAEGAGVPMTDRDFNRAHQAMKPPVGGFTPTTESDMLHDFSLSGKNDYLEWTGKESQRFGLVENNQDRKEDNAFRHALTAAIYTVKYGGAVTSELGWMNEQKDFNIISSLRGKIDLDKISDTNADLLNNRSGIAIAQQLIREKGAGNVTIEDLEKRVLEQLKAGKLDDHPDQELRTGRLAPEILSYHHMAGLIKWEAENGPTEADRTKAAEIVKARHIE